MTDDTRIVILPDDPAFEVSEADLTTTPEEDFYRFVNGGWIDANPVPAEYGAFGAFQEVHERNQEILHAILREVADREGAERGTPEDWVGAYYRSGMDTDRIEALGLEPIEALLAEVDAIETVSDLAPLLAEFHRLGIGGLFDTGVSPDFEDATVNLLYVGQAGLGLPDRDYYFRDDEKSAELLTQYRGLITELFTLLGWSDDVARTGAQTVLDMETAIADLSYTNVQMRDVALITNKHPMPDAADLMPRLGLGTYLTAIGAGGEDAVNIDNVGFFPGIDALLEQRPIEDWRTYLTWNVLRATGSSLPEAFDDAVFDFYGRKLGGQQEQKARWKRVLGAGSGDIGQLIAKLYVEDNFTPEAKARMEHLVNRLLDAMRDTIETITWMGDDTKAEALAKLDGFGYKIGYPDEWRDYTGLELEDGAWLHNRLACHAFEYDRKMRELGEPIDPHEWLIAPHIVNAYYHPLRNEIVFPAGILQPPYFDMEADDAVNYGAIGGVIGHEITHGFDDQGSRFDAEGNVRDWWTAEDRTEFDTRAKVMVEQFSAYEVEDGLFVNGELTLGENIADLGGLKIALKALEAELDGEAPVVGGLSPRQRFFMSWARVWRRTYTDEYLRLQVNSDPHSPGDLRCEGPLSNLGSFADAFAIAQDSDTMRPVSERVDIW